MVNFIITWIAKKTTTFNPVWLKLIHTINYTHFPQLAPRQCAAAMAKRPAPGAVPGPVGPVPWQLQGWKWCIAGRESISLIEKFCKLRTSFKWQFVSTILVHPASLCLVANRHLSPGRWWGCSGGTGCGGLWCFKSLRLIVDEQHSTNQLRSLTGEFLGYLYNNCIYCIPEVQIV